MALLAHHRKPVRGMALLVVLVVIALAGTVLTMLARQSCERAVLAAQEASALQGRWGQTGCRAVYLPVAERLIDEARRDGAPPTTAVRRSITLGGVRFDVVVADEQAKANANRLLARGKSDGLAQSLRRLMADQRRPLAIRLRPGQPRPGLISKAPQHYVSFDQLFDAAPPEVLLADDRGAAVASAIDRVGCWGSGQLNVRRAERLVMHEMLEGVLNERELDLLLRLREESPQFTLDDFFARLRELDAAEPHEESPTDKAAAARREEQQRPVREAVTDTSRCHSLWTVYGDGARRRYRLDVVQEGDPENDAQEWLFTW